MQQEFIWVKPEEAFEEGLWPSWYRPQSDLCNPRVSQSTQPSALPTSSMPVNRSRSTSSLFSKEQANEQRQTDTGRRERPAQSPPPGFMIKMLMVYNKDASCIAFQALVPTWGGMLNSEPFAFVNSLFSCHFPLVVLWPYPPPLLIKLVFTKQCFDKSHGVYALQTVKCLEQESCLSSIKISHKWIFHI